MKPFYNITCDELASMLDVKQKVSVISRIKEIGAPIHGAGKNFYVITEELLVALRKEKKNAYIYQPKNKVNDFF